MNINKPPGPIIATCFIMLAMTLFSLYSMSRIDLSQVADSQIIISLVSMTTILVSIYGIWSMKRWGVYLFTILFIGTQVASIANGQWILGTVFVPILIIVVCGIHLKKMS